jgi:AraC family transcriptional regulator of adaptative response/methylated-DNA-[protein]-cysteine methyltransferase
MSRVRFFETPAEAAAAGFRPCRRCQPDGNDRRMERVARACAYIRAHATDHLTLARIARHVGLSPHHLQRTFVKIVGMSPREYASACRLRALKAGLKRGESVTDAMYGAGYGSSSRLYEHAGTSLGMTPATYRKGGAGTALRYAIAPSRFGCVLVAATDRGIAAVKIGRDEASLVHALRREFHAASVQRDEASLGASVAALLASLEEGSTVDALPLDVAATAFQWRVWRALVEIPRGETRSYGEIARAIGRPSAARAVARACATNPVALVIPCHRVVPAGGGTGGYRWGKDVKQALIDNEKMRN